MDERKAKRISTAIIVGVMALEISIGIITLI